MPAIGDILAGRYRIDARLGAGGMATVWRARDLRLERDVAVKVLLPNLAGDPILASRFDREARSLAALSHPRVVGIHDVVEGAPGTEPFLVMELCPDGSLGDRLADGRALPLDDALPILADAAEGVAALHAAGLVHRDVTPRNVLLAGGRARLGDLGLARAGVPGETPPGGELTATGTAVGTLAYLAPEVLHGEPATTASDVYGLGAVVYRTLTGVLPHPAGTIAEVVTAREQAVAPLARMAPGAPERVATLVDRALAIDPAARPSAAELASALGEAAHARGVERPIAPAIGAAGLVGSAVPAADGPRAPAARADDGAATVTAAVPAATTSGPGRTAGAGQTVRSTQGRRPLPQPSSGYRGPGLWSGELVAVVVIAVVIVLLVMVLGGRPFFGIGADLPSTPPTSPAGAVSTPTPSPSPSPSATPSPTPVPTFRPTPTVDSFAAALALVDPVRAAIDAARGPGGLKGKAVKGLEDDLSAVAAALQGHDAAAARDAAQRLGDGVRALIDTGALTGDAAARLSSSMGDLVAAVGRLP